MSLDIHIKVDPGESVAKTRAVETALARTEERGRAAGKEMQGLAGSFRSLGASLGLERGGGIAGSLKILNERVRGIGKGMAFGLMAQQFDRLKGSIDDTSASALSAGASGAAMGATFAGPWGAAIGGAIGLTKGLVTGLRDEAKATEDAKKKIEEQGRAYWESVKASERKREVDDALIDTNKRLADLESELAERAQRRTQILNEQADALKKVANAAIDYQDALSSTDLQARQALGIDVANLPFGGGSVKPAQETQDVAAAKMAARRATLANIASYGAQTSYGGELAAAETATFNFKNRLEDLRFALNDDNLSSEARLRLQRELTEAQKQYNTFLYGEKNAKEDANARFAREIFGSESKPGKQHMEGEFAKAELTRSVDAEIAEEERLYQATLAFNDAKIKAHQDWVDSVRKASDQAAAARSKLLDDEAKAAAKAAQDTQMAWAQGLGSIGKSFLDAAREGEQSFAEMTESMLQNIAILILKMAALKAIEGGGMGAVGGKFLTGLLGGATGFDHLVGPGRGLELPGFARGGDMMVGGSGGTDSKIAMFRVTPGESVHVRTPEQQRAAAPVASAGRSQVIVQLQNDRRDLVQGLDSHDGQVVLAKVNRRMRGGR